MYARKKIARILRNVAALTAAGVHPKNALILHYSLDDSWRSWVAFLEFATAGGAYPKWGKKYMHLTIDQAVLCLLMCAQFVENE